MIDRTSSRFTRWSIRSFNLPPPTTPRWFKLLKIRLFTFRPPGARIVFKCPSQMPNLMVIFFVKGKTKSATLTFHILTKLKTWTLQIFSSEPFAGESELITFKHLRPYLKIKYSYSVRKTWHLQVQIPHLRIGMRVKCPWVAGGGVGVETSNWSVYY